MSILFAGLVPTKSSTFAVPFILPLLHYLCGFIHRGAWYGMGILFADYDNATMERYFNTLKNECTNLHEYQTEQ